MNILIAAATLLVLDPLWADHSPSGRQGGKVPRPNPNWLTDRG
ncbi:MAG: hypothetical protein V4812_03735 [Pseudomonadota bacterium]